MKSQFRTTDGGRGGKISLTRPPNVTLDPPSSMLLLCNVLRLEHTLSLATHYPTTHSRHQFSILFLFNPLSSPWSSSLLFALLFSFFSLVLFLPHPFSFLSQRLYHFLLRCSPDGLIDRHSRESVNRLHRERALVIRGRRNARQRTITSFVFLPLLKYVSPTLDRRSPVVTLFFFLYPPPNATNVNICMRALERRRVFLFPHVLSVLSILIYVSNYLSIYLSCSLSLAYTVLSDAQNHRARLFDSSYILPICVFHGFRVYVRGQQSDSDVVCYDTTIDFFLFRPVRSGKLVRVDGRGVCLLGSSNEDVAYRCTYLKTICDRSEASMRYDGRSTSHKPNRRKRVRERKIA